MGNESITILVVDDSLTQLAVLQDTLEEQGYVVDTARDGMEAISKVYHAPPALVLSDVMMPVLNGYHLCRLLKNDPNTKQIPVILLSQLAEQHDRFWGENAGADCYLEKGADLSIIVNTVAAILKDHPPQPSASPSLRDLDSEAIQSQVTHLLDRLLYESTISNEILKLTGQAHDLQRLARNFLQLTSALSRYRVAGLVLREGRDKYLLTLKGVAETAADELVAPLKDQILSAAGLADKDRMQIRVKLCGRDNSPSWEGGHLHVLHARPFVENNELLAYLVLLTDSCQDQTEGSRHALNVLGERFSFVARYLKQIKEIEDVKADFVSMLVHDMRSPLTGIRGFTDVLFQEALGQINSDQRGALENIQGGCDRLLTLIDDILDHSKLEAGKMVIHPSPLPLEPLVASTLSDVMAMFENKAITVATEVDQDLPPALGDGKQLMRVLNNLLTNAAKFTPPGGQVTVKISRGCRDQMHAPKDGLQVCVTNTGASIPTREQGRLFTRYEQLPSGSMFRKGTGLGLAICKEIISLHHGKIWVESPVEGNRGSRFCFTLPTA